MTLAAVILLTVRAVDAQPAPDTAVPAPEAVGQERATLDRTIRSELQAVFDRVPGLNAVNVSVEAGVVRLTGSVVATDTRQRAVALAESMTGVVYVDDRIQESTSLDEQLQPTWDRLRTLAYGLLAKVPLLVVALAIVGVAFGVGRLVARWTGPAFLSVRNPFLQNLIRRTLQSVLVVTGIVLALDVLQATALVGAVVGTAGVAGLAIGFAFKDIVENYLAGTILAIRQPFSKNDQIVVASFEGKVVRLTPRETILMTLDGNHVRLPNALVFSSPIVNYTRNPYRRFEFDLNVSTTDDLSLARQECVAALEAMRSVLPAPPPEALVMALGDSSVTIRCLAWIDQRQTEFARVRGEAIRLVKSRLEAASVTMPSPEFVIRMQRAAAGVEAAKTPSPPRPVPAPEQCDVSVDRSVDRQIDDDRRSSDEADLLAREPE